MMPECARRSCGEKENWIPAFAGMTARRDVALRFQRAAINVVRSRAALQQCGHGWPLLDSILLSVEEQSTKAGTAIQDGSQK
jgi:hypothetical protein